MKQKQQAFTLMELMIVLAIIAIMAGLIIPEMKGSMEDALLRGAGRTLVDVFSLASSRAISFNQAHRVRFDRLTGKYQVERRSENPMSSEAFEPIVDSAGFHGQIDPRITMDIRPLPIEQPAENEEPAEEEPVIMPWRDGINFYSDGTSDGCEILLRDRMGFKLVLQLNPITSSLGVQERDPDEEQER